MKTCLAIRHVAFEHLGTLGPLLKAAGYAVKMVDAGRDEIPATAVDDLLVVLGGPIGACEEDEYPFVGDEIRLIASRFEADQAVLGICLGAQLMVRALGVRVYPGPVREIGWGEVALTAGGLASPLRALAGVPVLHWHGDVFDLPPDAVNLAATAYAPHQAFVHGRSLGLQFHAEVDANEIESWLIGHAVEIAAAGLSPTDLRIQSRRHGEPLKAAARAVFADWLAALPNPP